jgi:hypothetical protein
MGMARFDHATFSNLDVLALTLYQRSKTSQGTKLRARRLTQPSS